MNAYLEYTHGVIRVYDAPIQSDVPCEGFVAVLSLTKVGPHDVLLSADLSVRRLTLSDVKAIKRVLIEAGFRRAYAWRRKGRRVPYGGRVIRECDTLALWEVDLIGVTSDTHSGS